jgi:Flp pilus assembly protein TadG
MIEASVARARRAFGEEGGTLVEMALCSSILLSMLLGIIQLCLALYCYHYVSDAAREATRWAIVRGSTSCSNTPNLTNCNATAAEVQSFVQSLGYPYSGGLTATTKWCQASAGKPTTWSTCSASTANSPGNQVQVQVQYSFPLGVPFVNVGNVTVSSTSQMVIAQ